MAARWAADNPAIMGMDGITCRGDSGVSRPSPATMTPRFAEPNARNRASAHGASRIFDNGFVVGLPDQAKYGEPL
ncbi:MAG: hypothetical protein IPO50_15795 [Sphingomonadales bacterium]|nr:hypothetical protein [Sphingomonadales bacterium]